MTVSRSPASDTKGGSRIAVPAENVCASCQTPRGNVRKGWEPITIGGRVAGWTCPACPTYAEPIRREVKATGAVRYLAAVSSTHDGRRQLVRKRFTTLDAARAWVAEVRAGSARTPTYTDPSRFTVRQLADRWLIRRTREVDAPGGIRKATLSGYRSALSSLLDLIGGRPAREVTPDDVEQALLTLATTGGKRGKPLAHRSLVYALGGLRLVYGYALRSGWVLTDPAASARTPREVHNDRADVLRRWTTAQLVSLREHVTANPDAGYPWQEVGVRLTLCGLRRSEVLGLDWRNVDTKAGTVRVVASRTKDGAGATTTIYGTKTENSRRTVAADTIHPGTARALRALWLAQGRPAEGLVIRDAIGQPVQPDAYSRRFVVLCKAAGVPVLTRIHNTRHTLATALQEAGVPDHQAAALLGHDVQTYRRFYLVTDDEGAGEAALVAGRLFAV
jgi:integrase